MSSQPGKSSEHEPGAPDANAAGGNDANPAGGNTPLARAYEQRTVQLREARLALGEAVEGLTTELAQRRHETALLREETAALRAERDNALVESRALRGRAEALDRQLRTALDQVSLLSNMKVVRWTAVPRRIVYRHRGRRG